MYKSVTVSLITFENVCSKRQLYIKMQKFTILMTGLSALFVFYF